MPVVPRMWCLVGLLRKQSLMKELEFIGFTEVVSFRTNFKRVIGKDLYG